MEIATGCPYFSSGNVMVAMGVACHLYCARALRVIDITGFIRHLLSNIGALNATPCHIHT